MGTRMRIRHGGTLQLRGSSIVSKDTRMSTKAHTTVVLHKRQLGFRL